MEPEEVVGCWHSDTDVFISDASEDKGQLGPFVNTQRKL